MKGSLEVLKKVIIYGLGKPDGSMIIELFKNLGVKEELEIIANSICFPSRHLVSIHELQEGLPKSSTPGRVFSVEQRGDSILLNIDGLAQSDQFNKHMMYILYTKILKAWFKKSKTGDFYSPYTPPIEIEHLARIELINRFKSIEFQSLLPLANLICGLLAEGRIPSINSEEELSASFAEQRLHEAIDYYEQAAVDAKFTDFVNYIVKDIKTKTVFSSVQERLSNVECLAPVECAAVASSSCTM
ncbi:hypothetical protein BN59_03086 [Legionella massiliensis]|uniref:Uncharacterized protein n=1 Tax=Legionella massiliensis TaxID=1034943 RepID=A0A078L0J2_9GAMM|nr:hypothetical protein [Legionella massiliensis]CDZ78772.1 hypothetical protein BN59_03086 [Legionella massiliensis]CEE14510.1 hypothetical protein BN1094_03086 [Legionella massiliensis]